MTELTELIDLSARGEGARLICRRERPHLGAQLSLFDTLEGYRHQCFLTTSAGEIAERELRHRARPGRGPHPCRQGHGASEPVLPLSPTRPGSSSCSPPWTSSPGPKPCAGNESYAVPRPRLDLSLIHIYLVLHREGTDHLVQELEMTLGVVRAGVARTKHQRERLSGRVAPGAEGMKAIAVLVLCTWQIRSGELREPTIGSGRWWWWWRGRQSGRRWACRGGRRWNERSSAQSGPSSDELRRG